MASPCLWINIHQRGALKLSLDGHQIRAGELKIRAEKSVAVQRRTTHESRAFHTGPLRRDKIDDG